MPLLPASLIEPLWVELAALIGSDERPEFDPTHPWGCHRRRISDRVVFEPWQGGEVAIPVEIESEPEEPAGPRPVAPVAQTPVEQAQDPPAAAQR